MSFSESFDPRGIVAQMQDEFGDLVVDEAKSTDAVVVYRSNITSPETAHSFVKKFSLLSRTDYIVQDFCHKPVRLMYRRTWVCRLNHKNKVATSMRNAFCKAFIKVLIKKVTRGTKKNDTFLNGSQPLPCIIEFGVHHSHVVGTVDVLRFLRVTEEVKQIFCGYFNHGMGPRDAKRFHERTIKLKDPNGENLPNASLNPTHRQVQHLYDSWAKKNLVSEPVKKLHTEVVGCEQQGTEGSSVTNQLNFILDAVSSVERNFDTSALFNAIERLKPFVNSDLDPKTVDKFMDNLRTINSSCDLNDAMNIFNESMSSKRTTCPEIIRIEPANILEDSNNVITYRKRKIEECLPLQ